MSGFQRVPWRLLAAVGLAATVAACLPRRTIEDQSRLALACEMMKCRCVALERSPFRKVETRPVQWRPDGSASCPEGFYLERPEDSQ